MSARVRVRIAVAVALALAILVAPRSASADDGRPPSSCGAASLGAGTGPTPHTDGRYTPVLLVHGFNGKPSMWSEHIDQTTLPAPLQNTSHTVLGSLQGLRGAAVYTLDYSDVGSRWFTLPGGGGGRFLDAVDCLARHSAFTGHRIVVVAHSMGGLITRWAVSTVDAGRKAGDRIRDKISLVITLGTPYQGSWLAGVGALLADSAVVLAARDPAFEALLGLVHLLAVQCARKADTLGCGELTALLDGFASMHDFVPGSPGLHQIGDWPGQVRVETLGTRIVLENAAAGLFLSAPVPGDLDLGDGVVATDSATTGPYPEKLGECRYTNSAVRADVDKLLGSWGLKATGDQRQLNPLVSSIFGSFRTVCGHVRQARLIDLTNEVLGAVAEELTSYDEPAYAYLSDRELGLVQGSTVLVRAKGVFGRDLNQDQAHMTEDGRYAFAVSDPGGPKPRIVVVDAPTRQVREIACGCVNAVPVGGSRIAWAGPGGQLMKVDLADTAAATAQPLHLPTQQYPQMPPQVVAGTADVVLVGSRDSDGPDTEHLFLVGPDGAARPLPVTGTGGPVWAAAATPATPGGPRIAYSSGFRSEACSGSPTVTVVDPTTGQRSTTDLALLRTQHAGQPDVPWIDELWWGRDGRLYATISSLVCLPGGETQHIIPASLWRLDGDAWINIDAGPVTAVRQLTRNVKAVVVDSAAQATASAGTLNTETDGKGVPVATGVWSLAIAPRGLDSTVAPHGTPLPAGLGAFVGDWFQHAGDLNVHPDGTIDLIYQVPQATNPPSFPHLKLRIRTVNKNTASAVVTASEDPRVAVGGTFSLVLNSSGITLTGPVPGGQWCDPPHAQAGDCGA